MSLINDALRRAKEAQQANPPPPESNLEFRPVEPDRKSQGSLLMWVAAGAVVCAVGVLFLLLRSDEPISAKPIANSQPATRQEHAAQVAPETAAGAEFAATTEAVTNAPAAEELTNAVSAVAEITPPAAPRLQAILFNPSRPSAVVNGKTVFVGTTVANTRVTAITETTVTLVGDTESHILTLE